MKLSVIIPHYKEPFLQKTIDSVKEAAVGDIEILPIDGIKGMRDGINQGLEKATGEFVMKLDAHCLLAKGFDKALTEHCQEDWLLIPRRYSLNESEWIRSETRPVRDYCYLSFPLEGRLVPQNWSLTSPNEIDDTMSFQGSCWVANRKYFMEHVGFLDDKAYGTFAGDQLEIGLKYWLGGGEVKVDKTTWYAHLAKRPKHYATGLFKRHYKQDRGIDANYLWAAKHWMNDEEPNMIHPFSWLIEKFWPVPTWPEDRNLWVIK